MDSFEVLQGGNSNRVVRDGDTVVRRTGPWSPFVHRLLEYLTTRGFASSPVLIEHWEDRERLSFLTGEVGNYPLKPYMQTDAILVEAARLLRRLHDATADFVPPDDAVFQLPARDDGDAHRVICHNDFAPYNCVFEDGHLVGVIDFDTAGPGSRLWDIAYAVYRFAPLATDAHCVSLGWPVPPERAVRLNLFCDAYGLQDRSALMATVRERIEALIEHMVATGSNLDHVPIYVDDLAYIAEYTCASDLVRCCPTGTARN